MTWRRVLQEFEADLYKVPPPRFFRIEKGELERKSYSDGEERLEIGFFGVKAPDGSSVSVVIDGKAVCEIPISNGRGKLVLSSREGHQVPSVNAGYVAEIHYGGRPVLRGVFKHD